MSNNKVILFFSEDGNLSEGEYIVSGKEANAIRTLLDLMIINKELNTNQKKKDEKP